MHKSRKRLIGAAAAAIALVGSTVAALAAPAVATSHVNVRSGPGTNFAVVDTLSRGQRVDIQHCRGNWCFVEKRGPNGWVSATYLDRAGHARPPGWNNPPPRPPVWNKPAPRPPVYNPRPPRPPVWSNPRPPHWNAPRPPQRPGASFCYNGPNGYFCIGS